VVLLNLDAGEHDDEPEELWGLCDIVCVACGGHAGDERSMNRVAEFCAAHERPRLGAHPSYPDRDGFGRRTIAIEPASLRDAIAEQCGALLSIALAHGLTVGWMKPHGALYHDAATNAALADAVIAGARDALGEITLIGPPRGALVTMRYLREGFADRRTHADGSLIPRSEPDALITDPAEAAARARELITSVDTICVHSDTPDALSIARAVREAIDG